ncbi:MAG: hypothetical protein Q4A61_00805 [Porphyromonadaceae bacterium]|nr:hypothetical protein [Porphyromonadaceae bacterium]
MKPHHDHNETRGAPCKYTEAHASVLGYIAQGYTLAASAKLAGISYSTLNEWRKSRPHFAQQLKEARAAYLSSLQDEIELSLYQRATGLTVTTEQIDYELSPEGEEIVTHRRRTTKQIPPDTAALIFALTNLDPDRWTNRVREEVFTATGKRITLDLNEATDAHYQEESPQD